MLSRQPLRESEHNSQNPAEPQVERDHPPVLGLIVFLVCISVILVIVGFTAKQLLVSFTETQNKEVNLTVKNPLLLELQAKYHEQLNSYDVIDQAKGHYRIPIDKAMEIVVRKGSAE